MHGTALTPAAVLMESARAPVPLAKAVRTSMIASSRQSLRELGLYERYLAALSAADRALIDGVVVGTWCPISVIYTHYEACDRMGLTVAETLEMGRSLSNRMHKPVFAVGVRLAGAAGMTPWHLAKQGEKMWPRMYDGGAFTTTLLGPKEGRIEIMGFPPAVIPYSRIAWRGVILGATELFSTRAYVNEIPRACTSTNLAYRVSWA
jgi:hypothetical protein